MSRVRDVEELQLEVQDPAGLGPDMFIAYSADGSAWSEQSTAGLVGSPSWVSPMAVGDDYAVMMISELDGPSSLWRAIMR